MRLWMAIGLGLVALFLVAAVLQAFNQLIWQLSYWLPGWLVAPLVLLLLAALALGLAQLVLPWWRRGGNGRPRRSSSPQPPASSRREAASRHLEAIDQTLDRVRDEVEREALRQERQRLQAELERGDLEIAVFGSGSTGKTSLIRALLNELVGSVAAAMGSTERSARYRLRLEGLPRAVILEDTPGILEGGHEGRQREELARRRAAKADLLLLVGPIKSGKTRLVHTVIPRLLAARHAAAAALADAAAPPRPAIFPYTFPLGLPAEAAKAFAAGLAVEDAPYLRDGLADAKAAVRKAQAQYTAMWGEPHPMDKRQPE
jgi:hypothetical protein